FTVSPNAIATLQVLMPGESADPGRPANWSFAGDPAGKSGTPNSPIIAGAPFTATVNATDGYFNVINSTNATVYLASDDTYGTPSNTTSLSKALSAGSTTFNVTFLSAENASENTIQHHLVSTWTLVGYQTPDVLMAAATPPTKLQIILPGQTSVPGNVAAFGVTGTPTTAVAG